MRKLLGLALVLVPMIAMGQSAASGSWRIDLSLAKMDPKPEIFLLRNGVFTCKTCTPEITVKADGKYHPVSGSPYVDQEKVTIKEARTVEIDGMRNGKHTYHSVMTVSADGNRLAQQFEMRPQASDQVVTGSEHYSRIGQPNAAEHRLSGSWSPEKLQNITANALTFTYQPTSDGMSYQAKTGESYDARFDGSDYPYHGDPGITTVSLRKISDNQFEETYKRDGKVTGSAEMTISPDGNSMTILAHSTERGTTDTFIATREAGSPMADK